MATSRAATSSSMPNVCAPRWNWSRPGYWSWPMSVNDSTCRADFGDGSTVLERVLLAIINAHTTSETEGRQQERLDAAMMALIGPATQFGHDLERALQFMARQRQRDICNIEMRALRSCAVAPIGAARTVPELAKLAACEVMG